MLSFKAGLSAIVGVFALSATPFAQAGAPPSPAQALLDETRAATGAPGMTAALISSDDIATWVSGVRRVGTGARVSRENVFHVGSDLKAMVATVIAQEVEAGRLRWDTTIGEVLPEVTGTARAEYRQVTLTQLLQHRAGLLPLLRLEDLAVVPRLRGSVVQQRRQFTQWVLTQPATSVPGTRDDYSNAGYVVAAAMLEKVTGHRTEYLLEKRLFAPLKMRSARFGWPAEIARRFEPWGHATVGERKFVAVSPFDPEARIPEWANVSGNLSLDTRDFARFVQLHLRGLRGTSTFLDPTTFQTLHTPTDEYALGWAAVEAGGARFSFHAGGTDLFYAVMVVVPDADRAAVVMINADNPDIEDAAIVLASQLLQLEP